MKTILEAIVGSTAHGTNVNDGLEDLDIMAIVIEDKKDFIGFSAKDVWVKRTKPEGVRSEAGDVDYVAYGLKKYLGLALKGNPTSLLPLFVQSPCVLTEEGKDLRELALYVVSKSCYMSFKGYMRQQHERLLGLRGQRNVTRPELVDKYGYDTKYAGHIVRLGLQGEELLLTGRMSLPMKEAQRNLVINVRNGKYSLAEISELIIEVEKNLDVAVLTSSLPDKPNRKAMEDWMIETYLAYWRNQ